jgi:hypothetical protein
MDNKFSQNSTITRIPVNSGNNELLLIRTNCNAHVFVSTAAADSLLPLLSFMVMRNAMSCFSVQASYVKALSLQIPV